MSRNLIVLVGLSGAGKSTVARLAAAALGWEFADTDAIVEDEAGVPVPEIFATEGEAAFRERELTALTSAMRRRRAVVATGGGTITSEAAWQAIACGFSIWLATAPASAAARLAAGPPGTARPLLAGDPSARLATLLADREAFYARADLRIDVDGLSPEEVAAAVVAAWSERSRGADAWCVAATVNTPGAEYAVVVEDGALARLGAICRSRKLRGRAFLLTDECVGPLLGGAATGSLTAAGYAVLSHAIPAGEEHKTLGTVSIVYDWLLSERAERSDFVVCLGGGVVTDLGGFAAATCLRGVAFVHVPTTLLGMVDAAIGGKTGIDHRLGKNMVGAFAQPRAVVIDPEVLASLPARQLRAGWAEVIKHALIMDAPLIRSLEGELVRGSVAPSADLIGWSTAIKAEVVSEDEREAGRRTLLNYGHTVGHAIEAVTGYRDYLHGEAVAIGMAVAGRMSVEMGLLDAPSFERQQHLLTTAGLPDGAPGVALEAVLDAMRGDKKVRAGAIRWVLLEGLGRGTVRGDVPDALVRQSVAAVLA